MQNLIQLLLCAGGQMLQCVTGNAKKSRKRLFEDFRTRITLKRIWAIPIFRKSVIQERPHLVVGQIENFVLGSKLPRVENHGPVKIPVTLDEGIPAFYSASSVTISALAHSCDGCKYILALFLKGKGMMVLTMLVGELDERAGA